MLCALGVTGCGDPSPGPEGVPVVGSGDEDLQRAREALAGWAEAVAVAEDGQAPVVTPLPWDAADSDSLSRRLGPGSAEASATEAVLVT